MKLQQKNVKISLRNVLLFEKQRCGYFLEFVTIVHFTATVISLPHHNDSSVVTVLGPRCTGRHRYRSVENSPSFATIAVTVAHGAFGKRLFQSKDEQNVKINSPIRRIIERLENWWNY